MEQKTLSETLDELLEAEESVEIEKGDDNAVQL